MTAPLKWRSTVRGWAREAFDKAFGDWLEWTDNGVCACDDKKCVLWMGATAYFAGAWMH